MQRTAFSLVVLVTLGLMGFFGLVVLQPGLFAGLLGHETAGHVSGHFREHHHRIHDLTFSFLLGTAAVGMLAQLRAPLKNVAGQLMALIPFIGLMLASALTNTNVLSVPWVAVGASTLLATTLHPTGRDLLRSLSVWRVNRVMLALVVMAAVPLLAFAVTNIGLQRSVTDDHATLGHYGFMAAFSFTVLGVGLLASLRPDGWRLTAWVAGLLPVLRGLTSVVFPDVASSLGLVWALAAIAWGVVFVAAAELTRATHMADPSLNLDTGDDTRRAPGRGSTTSTPSWLILSGIIAIVLVLLFGFMHLTGGGPGLHTLPSGGYGNPGGVGGPADADKAARTVKVTTLDTMTSGPAGSTYGRERRSRSG